MRDSAAPRSYVDWRSQAFSDSRAWLRKARSYIGKATGRTRAVSARCVLGVDFQIDPSSRESGWPGRSHSGTERRAFERSRDTVTWWKSRRHYVAPMR